jgi:peptidoglycan/LPS O-acetylase OafA/YrhL
MSGQTSVKERLAFLDVARGLAALLVLAEHGLDACLPHFLKSSLGYGNLGRAGVICFLLISGFIIPASLEEGGSNARFWLRRFFRLYPAYWLSIAIAYGSCCVDGQLGSGIALSQTGDWLLNLSMLQGFFARQNVWEVFWTLQLELVIYATCSLLFSARLLGRSGWIACLALGAYALLGLTRPLILGKPFCIGGQRLLYFAPLTGLLAQRFFSGRISRGALLAWVVCLVGTLVSVWSINHCLFPSEMTPACLWELSGSWGIASGCFFLLLGARRWSMPRLAIRLGQISYSVYLLHPALLGVLLRANWPAWIFLPSLLLSTLLLAELTYRLVELPGIALGRAVERHCMRVTRGPTTLACGCRREFGTGLLRSGAVESVHGQADRKLIGLART